MEPIAILLAVQRTHEQARSALPDAPVVPEPPHRQAPATRKAMAALLRRVADRLNPVPLTARPEQGGSS
jgi:hypothetical protein